jgi:predicted acyl esterase
MGPWSHGDWARNGAKAVIGNINFGDSISGFKKILKLHLSVVLKDNGKAKINYRKRITLTRIERLETYNFWPPENAAKESFIWQDKLMTGTMSFKSSLVTKKALSSRRILIKGLHQENT